MSSFARRALAAVSFAALLGGTATAQLLPSLPRVQLPPLGAPSGANLPDVDLVLQDVLGRPEGRQAVQPTLDSVAGLSPALADAGPATLLELRELRLRELVRQHPRDLETGAAGQPVRRGVLVTMDPDGISLQQALRGGFRVLADERHDELGLRVVTLAIPAGLDARKGLKRLKSVAPNLDADLDHLFEPAGSALLPFGGTLAATQAGSGGPRVGMIDGGVGSHPSLAGALIE
jgi:hypothetical protein